MGWREIACKIGIFIFSKICSYFLSYNFHFLKLQPPAKILALSIKKNARLCINSFSLTLFKKHAIHTPNHFFPLLVIEEGRKGSRVGLNFSPWQWENIRGRCFFISPSCLKTVKKSFTTIWAIWGFPHSQSLPLCSGGGKRGYLASKKWSYLSNLPTEIRSDYRFGNYRLCPFICDQSQLCSSIISWVISWRRQI